MNRPLLVAVAGVPPQICNIFISKLRRVQSNIALISCVSLDRSEPYTCSYAGKLYNKIANGLKNHTISEGTDLLAKTNFFLLYVGKGDTSEKILSRKFDSEALILRLDVPEEIWNAKMDTPNQKKMVANTLSKKARKEIDYGRRILSVIGEEIGNRDNRTCLLLPRKNFGRNAEKIFDFIREMSSSRIGSRNPAKIVEDFRKKLRGISTSLPTSKEGHRTYFRGDKGRVFKSPGKSSRRHGGPPRWDDSSHEAFCIIRSRVRFGASYDPKFHYDCELDSRAGRLFPSCHGEERIPKNRTHVNIAPNDNVR